MDEDQLHNRLNNHIRQAFDNYEDDTADEGWALLRQKFPEEKTGRGLFWLWYAAAAVMLLGIGLWLVQKPVVDKNIMAKAPKTSKYLHQTPDKQVSRDTQKQLAGAVAQQPAKNNQALQQASLQQGLQPAVQQTPSKPVGRPALAVKPAQQPAAQPGAVLPASGALKGQGQQVAAQAKPDIKPKTATVNPVITSNPLSNTNAVADVANTQQKAANAAKQADSVKAAESYAATRPAMAEKTTSADALNKLLAEKAITIKADKKDSKKVSLSVYAATYFNYAKGSDNQVNVGAGLTSDFKLSRKLKLSTGLSIGQNSLNYSSGQPSRGGGGNLYASASPANAALANVTAVSGSLGTTTFSAAPVANNYKASLIGLDIPINIKYQFNPQKSDAFISAGLSSGTFINETYVLNYTYAQGSQQSTTRNSFSGFDFGKTLNVSFGLGYPLGKSNRLIVEPFLKYPLDGLGSQQIKFGSGGVNLKLNFHPPKK